MAIGPKDHVEDFFCDSCHGEFMILIEEGSDVTPSDIKKCVFCGEDLDTDLSLEDESYDEGWEPEIEDDEQ